MPERATGSLSASARPFAGCLLCDAGQEAAPCTCVVQDRCSEVNDSGHQCVLGAGHTLRHVTAAGLYWR